MSEPKTLTRRQALLGTAAVAGTLGVGALLASTSVVALSPPKSVPFKLADSEWKKRLSKMQYHILREAGTERRFTSPLLAEKRTGTYHCAGCDQALFKSSTKFKSGTGWPSFYDFIPASLGKRSDTSFGMARTEYHCSNCGGHQGHVFRDGPKPTGLRYCNNGFGLTFKPASA